MPRAIPLVTRQSLESAAADEALVFLAEITHPEIAGVIRLVTDAHDWFVDGARWSRAWFELTLLTDNDNPPSARVTIPNIDRRASAMLLDLNGRARISFRVVGTSVINATVVPRVLKTGATLTPVYEARALELVNVSITAEAITAELALLDIRAEAWPSRRVTADLFPGATR